MPTPPDSLSVPDATTALLLLAEWTPPEGVLVLVSCMTHSDDPGRRRVKVALAASEEYRVTIAVQGVPNAETFASLTKAAGLLLAAAWDEPACIGIGPGDDDDAPADLFAPTGPLNLKATPHPIYDTARMGRDG